MVPRKFDEEAKYKILDFQTIIKKQQARFGIFARL
jgi:hypothetical protein